MSGLELELVPAWAVRFRLVFAVPLARLAGFFLAAGLLFGLAAAFEADALPFFSDGFDFGFAVALPVAGAAFALAGLRAAGFGFAVDLGVALDSFAALARFGLGFVWASASASAS